MEFLVFCSIIILASIFAIWKWKKHSSPLSSGLLCMALAGSFILFPLESLFLPGGTCFGQWETLALAVLQFCALAAALLLSTKALQTIIQTCAVTHVQWAKWQVWGAVVLLMILLCVAWGIFKTTLCVDFQYFQLPQIQSGHYDLMHTLVHTLMCEGILSLWNSSHAIILVQILLTIGLSLIIFKWGARLQVPVVFVYFAVLLGISEFRLLFWIIKDVPYALSMLLLCIGLCQYMEKRAPASLWMIGIGLFGTSSLRYDGFVPFALTFAALLFYTLFNWKTSCKLLYPLLASLMLWAGSFFVLPSVLDATPGASGTKYAKMAYTICAVVAEGGEISADDMRQLEQEILPRDVIDRMYRQNLDRCHPVISAAHAGPFIWDISENGKYSFAWNCHGKGELLASLFWNVARDNPLMVARILLLNSQITWNMPNRKILLNCPPPLFMYYGFVLVALLLMRRVKLSRLIPFVPFFSVPLVIAISATTYEPRYLLAMELSFPVLMIYAVVCFRSSEGREVIAEREVG